MQHHVATLVTFLLAVQIAHGELTEKPSVQSIREYYKLPSEQAQQGIPVRFEAVVLYSDAAWKNLWVYDGQERLYLRLPDGVAYPSPRRRVLVSGNTALKDGRVVIADLKLVDLGPSELPPPRMLTPRVIRGQESRGARVSMAGTVMNVSVADGHLRLAIAFLYRFQVRVVVKEFTQADAKDLLGAHVGVVGCAADYNGRNADETLIAPTQIYVPDMEDLTVYKRGTPNVFDSLSRAASDAGSELSELRDPRLVVLRGKVAKRSGPSRFTLKDGTGSIDVELVKPTELEANQTVEAAGFFWKGPDGAPFLACSFVRNAEPVAPNEKRSPKRPAAQTEPVLRTTQAVRALSVTQASRALPVELNGIVTYCDPIWRVIFVQDPTGGIYVNSKQRGFRLTPGERVRVRGTTDPGGYAPMVEATTISRLGKEELPIPRRIPLPRLFSGAEDSQWITTDGRVQQALPSQKNLVLTLRSEVGEFEAVLYQGSRERKLHNWVGARVRLTGVCGVRANQHRQVQGLYFHIPGIEFVEFLEIPPDDPFDTPVTKLAELLRFPAGEKQANTMVRVDGCVTYSGKSGQIALQDGTRGIVVHLGSGEVPAVGTCVNVVGFPDFRRGGPTLRDVKWRACPKECFSPDPLTIPADQDFDASHNAMLVSLKATVVENNAKSSRPSLTLRRNGAVFTVSLPDRRLADSRQQRSLARRTTRLSTIEPKSLIQLTGVCEMHADEWNPASTFRVLVAQPDAITVLRAAPWWDWQHTVGTIVVLLLVVLTSLAWGSTLRRRVEEQTQIIRSEMVQKGQLSARYDSLVRNAGELIFSLTESGTITAVNPAAERAFGVDEAGILGKQIWPCLTEQSDRQLRGTIRGLSTRRPYATLELFAGEDPPRTLETGILLRMSDGEEKEFQCIARDVTDRRELENQIRHMQKMDSVGQLAAGVAHDYNNLMTVVLGNCELLQLTCDLDEQEVEPLTQIYEAADRAASLTHQLLAFSRRQIMNVTDVEPARMLKDLSGMLRRLIGENIEVVFDVPASVSRIKADRGMLEQVILNLVVNGRDAMTRGGTLRISAQEVRLSSEDTNRTAEALPGDYVRFSVTDTGHGIAQDHLSSIFEPFFTTKPPGKGTGLGLSTVFGIAKQHQGWVEAESQIGEGSTFHVFIPLGDGPSDVDSLPAEAGQGELPTGGHETILVVEDDEAVRRTMVVGLKKAGYEVIECSDGPEALDRWNQHREKVDLLITDMIMPGGLSGQDVAREVRRTSPSQRVIYCSGYSLELTSHNSQSDLDRLLPKPFEHRVLIRLVREVLDHATRTRSSV